MKRVVQFIWLLLIAGVVNGQSVSKKLAEAVAAFKADPQMRYGMLGFYVVDQKTGAVVYDENAKTAFTMASAQKVITSIAALELLGGNYRYKTQLAYDGKIENGVLKGNLYLVGSGDPTLGSWRYDNTKEQVVLNKWTRAIKQAGIKTIDGSIIAYNNKFETQTIPGSWIWDDIGNYYGAGVAGLNWRENVYDLKLKSGARTGDVVSVATTQPKLYNINLVNELRAGKPGSGDNAYIYLPPYATTGFIRGTIPAGQSAFTVSGSFPDPARQLIATFIDELTEQGIEVNSKEENINVETLPAVTVLNTHTSPSLDSLNYWFLTKSINLYGEALVKTLALAQNDEAATEAGLTVIKNFWKANGVDPLAINIYDGSGLSPRNKVTPEALVRVMQYARSKPWFSSFYKALPEFNGIVMKSGTMGGVKSFTGYVSGYTFAVVTNNYNGSSSEITRKIYKLLDVLK